MIYGVSAFNCYAFQIVAISKYVNAYACSITWNVNTLKAYTSVKCTIVYALNHVRNNYTQKIFTTRECRSPYNLHIFSNHRFCKPRAVRERIIAYARYAVRYCYARKVCAPIERSLTYARHAVRNCYARKARTPGKRTIAYPRHLIPVGRYSRYHDVGIRTAADAADIAGAVTAAYETQPFAGFCLRVARFRTLKRRILFNLALVCFKLFDCRTEDNIVNFDSCALLYIRAGVAPSRNFGLILFGAEEIELETVARTVDCCPVKAVVCAGRSVKLYPLCKGSSYADVCVVVSACAVSVRRNLAALTNIIVINCPFIGGRAGELVVSALHIHIAYTVRCCKLIVVTLKAKADHIVFRSVLYTDLHILMLAFPGCGVANIAFVNGIS